MKRSIVAITLLLFSPFAAPSNCEFAIKVNPAAMTEPEALGGWITYATTLAAEMEKNDCEYSLDAEALSRQALADFWKAHRTKPEPYLDDLLAVVQAGYLEEYVWDFWSADQSAPIPSELDMAGYSDYKARELENHTPVTGANVSRKN